MNNFRPPLRIEQMFKRDIWRMMQAVFGFSPSEPPAAAENTEAVRLLRSSEWLEQYAQQAAQRMVHGLIAEQSRSWRAAAGAQSQPIYAAIHRELQGRTGLRTRQLIRQNALLIRSLPEDIRTNVALRIGRETFAGERAENIRELIPHVSQVKAQLIARTETSKASTALTRARAEDLGLQWYVWNTSSDGRVRPAHKLMSGVLIAWDTPPSPEQLYGIKSTLGYYNAGDAPNCRCYPAPLVNLNTVSWPRKVYYANRIVRMSLSNFRTISRFSQLEEAA